MSDTVQTWPGLLSRLTARVDLSRADTAWAMDQIMSGTATGAQIGGFVAALRAKGEVAEEIEGLAEAMLGHARRIEVGAGAVDVVGTGGDGAHTVNISTMTSIVVAAAGLRVVKHGNRAASSKCGTADVLERLGVAIDLTPEAVEQCVRDLGIGFCFAPTFHPAMRYTGAARRELGIPTAFNVLGPLTNPAQPSAGLIGCADPRMAPVIARVLAGRGNSVLLVRGDDGLDELTTTTTSTVWVIHDGQVRQDVVDPDALGVPLGTAEALRGGEADFNAEVVRELVAGRAGPVRDAVLLNAAGALTAHDGFRGPLASGIRGNLERAAAAIDSGAAAELLSRWIDHSTALRSRFR
ncbi:anthranilate phosphoribosyltransferase [Actinoalloteichus sp. AHMU CJ021]|uniref:Anthranilate phosphoribosyltransferase n=1 Tax=Actinoalloteichus caeruleus DSM 43889 TaxID=1120930 RepID=A0ABT1JHH7_ACTCY|nr:anthranilate phosphoribosyltransferase [Actinoalloteichus caeruleus]AUS77927.1 anthranilate phosphoribosyltransferase [Actinoalloteichus sp. AHMU CJ021]MCP2331893.1 anthranilate phosphoribosyltransferase [Actinoalloteichus caeruleus DSM 43889]